MKLAKSLALLDIVCLASGAMISSGLFVLPGLAFAKAGPSVVVSYFLAGLFATTGLLSIAELATAMPKAGGDYFFIRRSMGPAVGTVAGLLTWFSLSLKSSFALVGMAAFATLIGPLDGRVAALVLCALFVVLNLGGAKAAGRFQVPIVLGLFALSLLYIVKGLPAVQISRLEPFAPGGAAAIFSTAGFVFVAYGGLLNIASVSGEVRDPGRTIPLGLILSLLIVSVLYTLMVLVTVGVLDGPALAGSLTPISDGAAGFMGRGGQIALGVAAVLAFLSTANAGIMAASRYLLALSRDGLLPERLGAVNRRFRTPHVAVLVTGSFVAASLFLKLDILVESASTVLLLGYMLSNLSVIVLRESRLQNYQPSFRSPLYPWVQIAGIVGLAFMLFEMGEDAFAISAVLILCGFLTYWLYGRSRSDEESGLLHLIQRLTARELVTGSMETELREIIRERDDIVQDRFDRLIENAIVLDPPKAMSCDDFFAAVADRMAPRLGMPAGEFLQALRAREAASSTVIGRGLAIPHVVVPAERPFDILLARCRPGITFPGHEATVHTVFVLAGGGDDRNFHLRALAAIAQVAQDPKFDAKWLAARNEQALRDIVLLGHRRRGRPVPNGQPSEPAPGTSRPAGS